MSEPRRYELLEIEVIPGGVLVKTNDDAVQIRLETTDALWFAHALIAGSLESVQKTGAMVEQALAERGLLKRKSKLRVVE